MVVALHFIQQSRNKYFSAHGTNVMTLQFYTSFSLSAVHCNHHVGLVSILYFGGYDFLRNTGQYLKLPQNPSCKIHYRTLWFLQTFTYCCMYNSLSKSLVFWQKQDHFRDNFSKRKTD